MLSIIVAIAKNSAIGKGNNLLCHISEDLKYFKKTTLNSPVIMGRKTWESLPKKPLPNRENIIISRNPYYKAEGGRLITSLDEAITLRNDERECFVIGGEEIYRALLPYCQRLYITQIDKEFEADTFFPTLDLNNWEEVSKSETHYDINQNIGFRFVVYKRKDI